MEHSCPDIVGRPVKNYNVYEKAINDFVSLLDQEKDEHKRALISSCLLEILSFTVTNPNTPSKFRAVATREDQGRIRKLIKSCSDAGLTKSAHFMKAYDGILNLIVAVDRSIEGRITMKEALDTPYVLTTNSGCQ
jgi:hypothetical protein